MDIGLWTCPICGLKVEWDRVADSTLPTRISEHKKFHELLKTCEFVVSWCEVNQREKTKLYDVAKAAIDAAKK
jgi:hypothetical protein